MQKRMSASQQLTMHSVHLCDMKDQLTLQYNLALLHYRLTHQCVASKFNVNLMYGNFGNVGDLAIIYWIESGHAELFRKWLNNQDASKIVNSGNLCLLKKILNEVRGVVMVEHSKCKSCDCVEYVVPQQTMH